MDHCPPSMPLQGNCPPGSDSMRRLVLPGVELYLGDCRELLATLKADAVITDPPYGIKQDKAMHKASGNVVGHGHRRVAKRTYEESDWDKEPVAEWVMHLARSICQKQIIFGGNYYQLPPCKGPLVWDKENGANDFADGEIAWNNLGTALRIKRHRRLDGWAAVLACGSA